MSYNFRLGDKIVITMADANQGKSIRVTPAAGAQGSKVEYISQVEFVESETEVVAHVPIYQGRLTRLSMMSRYSFVFHTRRGMVRYIGRVESYFKEDAEFMMRIKLLSTGEVIQRREFFRFSCVMPFEFNLIDENGQPALNEITDDGELVLVLAEIDEEIGVEAYNADNADGADAADSADPDEVKRPYYIRDGLIKDISGGGLCFLANQVLNAGQRVRCLMTVEDELLIAIGKIMRKKRVKYQKHDYEYQLSFTGIRAMDRERIVRYIFNAQRKQLKVIR